MAMLTITMTGRSTETIMTLAQHSAVSARKRGNEYVSLVQVCGLVTSKDASYMDACMYVIARSVYRHRFCLVGTWIIAAVIFTIPALILVVRRTVPQLHRG